MGDFADDCLDGLAAVARVEAAAAAAKIRLVAAYAETAAALEAPAATPQEATARDVSLAAEIACVLAISEPAANLLLNDAHTLTTTLPLTLNALETGTVSWQHARIIVDETTGLTPDGAAALEAHFLDPDAPEPARGCPAGNLPPSRFRAKARTWRERHHPASIEKRHAKGVTDRRVEYTPDRDGMAWLSAYLPATTATGIWNRLTTTARALQGPDETRTLTQLRPDILTNWLLSTQPGTPAVKAQVLVTVPVFSLLGATDEPAMLDGYGPIPASMARDLVAHGADSFYRVLTDPRDGAPLDIGRTSYRITAAIRRALTLRDGKCTFPGCNNHTPDNDTDHLHPWHNGGTTAITNLGQLCPKHHRLKHNTKWTPTPATRNQPPDWTSPTGRHYQNEHPDWQPPQWPKACAMPQNEEPPPGEPPGEGFVEASDLSPDDPLWDDFYARPAVLPRDPVKEWDVVPG